MPNHCFNRVNIYCDKPEVIKEIHDIFEIGTNPYVDKTVFGQIIPEPDWKVTPNDNGELPIQPDKDSMFPPKFPDGTTGESPTGVRSGIATISPLTKMMNKN